MDAEHKIMNTNNTKLWDNLSEAKKLQISTTILKKPFNERTPEDIAMLVRSTEKISFFQELGRHLHQKCCNYLTYDFAEPDTVIMKEGDDGSNFFIILSGSVGVHRYVDKEQSTEINEKSSIIELYKEKSGPKMSLISSIKLDESLLKSNDGGRESLIGKLREKASTVSNTLVFLNRAIKRKEEKVLVEQVVLRTGESFGERALLANAKRKATIITKEPSVFACLEKEFFDETLKEREIKVHADNIQFLQSLHYFNNFSYHLIEQIYYVSKKQKYTKNQIVYSEQSSSDFIYIISSGEFKFMKSILIKDENDMSSQIKDLSNCGMFKKKSTQKNGELAIFSKGEIFGESEVIKNIPRTTSVSCESRFGELYVVPRQIFLSKIYTELHFKSFIDKQRQFKSDMYKKRHELIENLTNQNKNLLTFVSSTPESRGSKIYNSNQKSSFFDLLETTEKQLLERPYTTSLDHKQTKSLSIENLSGFFRESFSYGQRLKEALENKSKDHSVDETNNSKIVHARGKSISTPPTAAPIQRLSFIKPVTRNKRLKSTANSSTTNRRGTSTKVGRSANSAANLTRIISEATPYIEEKKNIYPYAFNTEKLLSSPTHHTYNETPNKYQLTQTLSLENNEQSATFDYSIFQPVSKKPSNYNLNISDHNEKNYLLSHYRSNLKLAVTSPNSKETTESRSFFVETPYSVINDIVTFETVQNTKESLFAKAHDKKKIVNRSMHIGRVQPLSTTNVLNGSFKSNYRQEDKISKQNGASFISISAEKHWPFESIALSVSPRQIRSAKKDVVIGPLKRLEFFKETRKTQDFMRYKLTGK